MAVRGKGKVLRGREKTVSTAPLKMQERVA